MNVAVLNENEENDLGPPMEFEDPLLVQSSDTEYEFPQDPPAVTNEPTPVDEQPTLLVTMWEMV